MTSRPLVTALVLAGSRRGESDPVARYRQAAAKCLVTAGGVPMLVRVVQALAASPRIGTILVSVDDEALLDRLPELAPLRASGRLQVLASAASLSDSVAAAFALAGPPMLVTTADHALLDPAMLDHFLAAADVAAADIAVALASAAVITAAYPQTQADLHPLPRRRLLGCQPVPAAHPRGRSAASSSGGGSSATARRPGGWPARFGPVLLGAYLLRIGDPEPGDAAGVAPARHRGRRGRDADGRGLDRRRQAGRPRSRREHPGTPGACRSGGVTRLKIAMLSNPLSQRNRAGMARIEAVLAGRPDIRHVRFEPGMDLQALLAELAAWECGLIMLNSGDGLVHARARARCSWARRSPRRHRWRCCHAA